MTSLYFLPDWIATGGWTVFVLMAFLAVLAVDHHQTYNNLAIGYETNRAILFLHRRLADDGVAIWFGGWACVALLLFAGALHYDKPGILAILGTFGIGLESSYVLTNLNYRRHQP